MKMKPFLVVGESIVAPLMSVVLRGVGLDAHLLQRKPAFQTVDQGSIILTPTITNYLTEDLGLAGARPPGNMVTSYYSYDNSSNILMNLNLDTLHADDGGTFFCCQRSVIEKLLLRECEKPRQLLEHENPVQIHRDLEIISLSQNQGGVTARFSNGKTETYSAIINVSRDMDAVPLINTEHEVALSKREEIKTVYKRAVDNSHFFLDWTIPIPQESWELSSDEVAEIIHRQGRRIFVRPVSSNELSITTTMSKRGSIEDCSSAAGHYTIMKQYWDTADPVTHNLWTQGIMPALQDAVPKNYKKIDYYSPTYCFDKWTEEGGRIIRVGPAAHGSSTQPIDVADAIDFKDCFYLASHLAANGTQDVNEFLEGRRTEVVDEMNSIASIDDISMVSRSKLGFAARRTYHMWTKSYSRGWKRALRPFC